MFPKDFVWGVATASYQIEGAAAEDGRTPSIWDTFSRTPGRVANGDTGDVACDHYHRYPEDIRLMQALGVKAYRFSISWSRVIPDGKGAVNAKGMDFYKRLVDALLAANITPYATLYHWDLPQTLEDDGGGWLNRATTDHFAHYADEVSKALGDRVKHWMTFNEPLCIAYVSYVWGAHAPGVFDLTYKQANIVAHHVNVAHGKAVPILRANSANGQVGIVLNLYPAYPATASAEDVAAAQRDIDRGNRWFLDPIFKGQYPADRLALLPDAQPPIADGDMQLISQPLDFLGINYYSRNIVKDAPDSPDITKVENVSLETSEFTDMAWEVYPDGLRALLTWVHEEYQPKAIYVTENGSAAPDMIGPDGAVHDPSRITYLREHLRAAAAAVAQGVPLKGYFLWSLLDNFEWAYGYTKRFGIIYTDYATQQRIPKDSYYFYQKVIARGLV